MALQEPSYLILVALLEGPAHGYRMIEEVERVSLGQVRLRAGTLYGALDRLHREGLVELDNEAVVSGRLRRSFRLTPLGERIAGEETDRRVASAAVAAQRLRLRRADLPPVEGLT